MTDRHLLFAAASCLPTRRIRKRQSRRLCFAKDSGHHRPPVEAPNRRQSKILGRISEEQAAGGHRQPMTHIGGISGVMGGPGAAVAIGVPPVGQLQLVGSRATQPGELMEGKEEASQSTSTHDTARMTPTTAAKERVNRLPHGRLLRRIIVSDSLGLPANGTPARATPQQLLCQSHCSRRAIRPQ